jgi:hypothetical protein
MGVYATKLSTGTRYRRCTTCVITYKTHESIVPFAKGAPKNGKRPVWLDKAIELRNTGLLHRQIAERLARYYPLDPPSKEQVRRYTRKEGLPSRVIKAKPPKRKLIPYAGRESLLDKY